MIHFIKRKLYSECPFCKLMIPIKATSRMMEIVCGRCGKHHHIIIPDWYLDG